MFRKEPLEPYICCPPSDVFDEVRQLVDNEQGGKSAVYLPVSSVELSKHQLDPRVMDMKRILSNPSEIVEPGDFLHMLNITDVADIEARDLKHYQFIDKYMHDHKKEIDKFLNNKENG